MKYLITGGDGQLAREFRKTLESRGRACAAPGRAELDITDAASVRKTVESFRPDVILNCAAYNLVDAAEQDRERASRVNAAGPGVLAAAAKARGAFLVHFSTDYVFDGTKENGLYTEEDDPNPLSHYGASKLAGEQRAAQETDRFLLFRLSWVFGDGKQNFIAKLLEWTRTSPFLKVACDEFSVPTAAPTIVAVTLRSLEQGLTGLYHLTNSGFCSRYEWARLVLRELNIRKFIRPVSLDSFQLPAKRPKFSAMSNDRLSRALGITIPSWEEGVSGFLRERKPAHA